MLLNLDREDITLICNALMHTAHPDVSRIVASIERQLDQPDIPAPQVDEARHVIEQRLWVQEFGPRWKVPAEVDALVESGYLADASWHNDVMPSFTRTDNGVVIRLWVDAEDVDDREYVTKNYRFAVDIAEEDNYGITEYLGKPIPVVCYEGNDVNEAIAALRKDADQ